MGEKYASKIDIAVLMLFFCRAEQFSQVFNAVREARPSRLYLCQDGARNEKDMPGIMACREIAENIDWECEVHRLYRDKNYGCDPSGYMAQRWFFDQEEMGIVLEDDVVPGQSFFPYCKELLEKYKDDQRINMICGMNNLGTADWCPYSYLFSRTGSIWGWATWKRVVDEWDEQLPYLEDEYYTSSIKKLYEHAEKSLKRMRKHNELGIAHFEVILGANARANSRLNIIPTKNMISNVGISESATHTESSLKTVPKGIRSIYFMQTHKVDVPLKHPPYIIEDREYLKRLNRLMGNEKPLIKFYRKAESIIRRIIYGDGKSVIRSIKRKLGIKNGSK